MLYVYSLKRPSPMVRLSFLAGGVALLLAGCGGSDNNDATTPVAAAVACADLTGKTVPAASIGLPTGGATVTSATVVAATDANNTNGEYCKVLGKISPAPTAPTAPTGTPDINFQLNLPSNWNGKTVHMGGGGYNGTVVTGLTALSFAPGTAPLSQGYATFGSPKAMLPLDRTRATLAPPSLPSLRLMRAQLPTSVTSN